MNTNRIILWLAVVLILAGATTIYYLGRTADLSSKLVQEIEDYREKNGEGANLDITPVIARHIETGMPLNDVVVILQRMKFTVTESHFDTWHDDKSSDAVYSAIYRKSIGPKIFHLYRTYKYSLYFKNGKLVDFKGVVRGEQP